MTGLNQRENAESFTCATLEDELDFASTEPALELAGALAIGLGTSIPMPERPQDTERLARFESFRFGHDASRIGWAVGEGPTVLLVHGYSGRGVQMAAVAETLAAQGFRAVFFDAGGHGNSRNEKIGFFTFIEDTRAIAAHLGGEIHAMIGHSAGGLAMMRARDIHGVRASRYAVIAAPFFPYVPLETMQGRGATEEALGYVKAILADQFRTSWSALVAGAAYQPEPGRPLLAIYDRDDDRVRHADADRLQALWPGTITVKTEGFGHNRVLQAPETLAAIGDFMRQ